MASSRAAGPGSAPPPSFACPRTAASPRSSPRSSPASAPRARASCRGSSASLPPTRRGAGTAGARRPLPNTRTRAEPPPRARQPRPRGGAERCLHPPPLTTTLPRVASRALALGPPPRARPRGAAAAASKRRGSRTELPRTRPSALQAPLCTPQPPNHRHRLRRFPQTPHATLRLPGTGPGPPAEPRPETARRLRPPGRAETGARFGPSERTWGAATGRLLSPWPRGPRTGFARQSSLLPRRGRRRDPHRC
mmetsp:Transcript_18083/g.37126  ORF Transcript_18083/g.37126 Transcript_18083/m.37126 type:complete len:251 (-) Transcript_18083:946-1698(-)